MYVLMDGVQVPVVATETEGRTGRVEGQRARTRECKLGCVFLQSTVDEEGGPIRDPDSTTMEYRRPAPLSRSGQRLMRTRARRTSSDSVNLAIAG
jgi:hypothetical protein